jgi:hypothetical protein
VSAEERSLSGIWCEIEGMGLPRKVHLREAFWAGNQLKTTTTMPETGGVEVARDTKCVP